jgi:hypothetical protein
VVRLGSPGISHRSSAMPCQSSRLRRAPISAHRPPFPCAQSHQPSTVKPLRLTLCPLSAENGWPPGSSTAAPPCATASSFPSTLGHASYTVGLAACCRSGSWSPPRRRTRRLRGLADQRRLCPCVTDPWGLVDPGTQLQHPTVDLGALHRVHSAFSAADF